MRIHEHRLRRGLLLLAVIPALVVTLLVLLVTSMARLEDVDAQFDVQAEQMSRLLASSLDYPLISNQPQLAIHGMDGLLQPGIVVVQVRDSRQAIWLRRERPGLLAADRQTRWLQVPIMAPSVQAPADDWLGAAPAPADPVRLGTLEVRLDPLSLRQRELGLLVQTILLALAALMVVSTASWLIASRVVDGYDLLRLGVRRRQQRRNGEVGARETHWRATRDSLLSWGQWSHDVRTPLNGVTGMLELLSTTRLDAEQTGYLAHARAAADSLLETLDRVPPVRDSEVAEDDEAELTAAQRRWQGRRVLLVEDDLVSQHLAQGLFASWGVALVCVATGSAGLALHWQDWDLILVDGELPDMQADEFARAWQLLASETKALPPMVAVTAHTDPAHLARYSQAGLVLVLDKPLRRRSVLMVLTPLIA